MNTELNTAFEDAVAAVNALDVSTAQCIKTVTDYVNFADQILRTPPYQDGNSRNVYNAISTFYLYMQQPTLLALQSPVEPGTTKNGTTQQQLTWLSAWLREYAIEWGVYLDTDQSATCVDTFKDDEWFCWDDYLIPDEGFRTFNEYFARDFINLNIRPVNCSDDPDAVVFPADATFMHSYNISDVGDMDTNNPNELINAKGLVWSIQELLFLSEYRNEFNGGVFAHSFLSTYNYHRWHAPVAGTIVERRVISGQFYLDVTTLTNHEGDVIPDALDDAGYQFVMQRGKFLDRSHVFYSFVKVLSSLRPTIQILVLLLACRWVWRKYHPFTTPLKSETMSTKEMNSERSILEVPISSSYSKRRPDSRLWSRLTFNTTSDNFMDGPERNNQGTKDLNAPSLLISFGQSHIQSLMKNTKRFLHYRTFGTTATTLDFESFLKWKLLFIL